LIAFLECTECGREVRVGVPDDATVRTVSAESSPTGTDHCRVTECEAGHEVRFAFRP
jgi:hypothetical protein